MYFILLYYSTCILLPRLALSKIYVYHENTMFQGSYVTIIKLILQVINISSRRMGSNLYYVIPCYQMDIMIAFNWIFNQDAFKWFKHIRKFRKLSLQSYIS